MIEIVWEFIVKPEAIPRFEEVYGSGGDWAALFRQHPGYKGTTLLQDKASNQRFLTIDRWESELHFNEMLRRARHEYDRLDRLCGELTISGQKVGVFRSL